MPHRPRREGRIARWFPRGPAHLGRRGAFLLIYGIIWLMLGVSVIDGHDNVAALTGEVLFTERMSDDLRAFLWIFTGSIAMLHAFRPPGMSDALGFLALYLMPAIMVASYGLAWVDSWNLLDQWLSGPGSVAARRPTVIYSAMLISVLVVAGWSEPSRAEPPVEEHDDGA